MSARTTKPHEIVERALELSRSDGCVVIADEHSSANLRWAGNALTTNGVTRGRTLTVIATVDGAQGTASGVVSRSAVTVDELEPLVRAAETAARGTGPAEDAQPLVTGVDPSPEFTEAPAETTSAAPRRVRRTAGSTRATRLLPVDVAMPGWDIPTGHLFGRSPPG